MESNQIVTLWWSSPFWKSNKKENSRLRALLSWNIKCTGCVVMCIGSPTARLREWMTRETRPNPYYDRKRTRASHRNFTPIYNTILYRLWLTHPVSLARVRQMARKSRRRPTRVPPSTSPSSSESPILPTGGLLEHARPRVRVVAGRQAQVFGGREKN